MSRLPSPPRTTKSIFIPFIFFLYLPTAISLSKIKGSYHRIYQSAFISLIACSSPGVPYPGDYSSLSLDLVIYRSANSLLTIDWHTNAICSRHTLFRIPSWPSWPSSFQRWWVRFQSHEHIFSMTKRLSPSTEAFRSVPVIPFLQGRAFMTQLR